MSFWKWLVNRYKYKYTDINITIDWWKWMYLIGAIGAFIGGVSGYFLLFLVPILGLTVIGIGIGFAIMCHYGWYRKFVKRE